MGLGLRFLIGLAIAIVCCQCGASLSTRAEAIGEVIETARKNGAETCAPVQLAMAESHHVFAETEISEGDYYRAKEELRVAEHNANQALDLSPKGRCRKDSRRAQEPPTDGDSDGDGVPNATDDCPRRPEDMDGYKDADGCPEQDNDLDGIVDAIDECPDEAEDRDGYRDQDGCPDLDNDDDGLTDRNDQCPDKAEDDDGFEDDDGCPDCDNDADGVPECPEAIDKCPDVSANTPDGCPKKYKNVVVTKKKIEIKQTIYFDSRKSTIQAQSYEVLNDVARALLDNPSIKIRIEGHTDSRGSNAKNRRLSQGRAESVRNYIVNRNIDKKRMVAKGYGEDVPISDNRTRHGREQNRRVEFVITSW